MCFWAGAIRITTCETLLLSYWWNEPWPSRRTERRQLKIMIDDGLWKRQWFSTLIMILPRILSIFYEKSPQSSDTSQLITIFHHSSKRLLPLAGKTLYPHIGEGRDIQARIEKKINVWWSRKKHCWNKRTTVKN